MQTRSLRVFAAGGNSGAALVRTLYLLTYADVC
jgi:hypothetical protein